MMKKLLCLALVLWAHLPVFAQDPGAVDQPTPVDSARKPIWKGTHKLSSSFSQTTLSDNWKGGGTNMLALSNVFLSKLTREGEHLSIEQNIDLQYGLVRNQGIEPRKITDRIFYDLVGGWKLPRNWRAVGSVNFISQFAVGYDYPKAGDPSPRKLVSRFMAPGYLTEALGLEYKPKSWFSVRFGVGGLRHTFVVDTTLYRTVPSNYGVKRGHTVRTQAVFQLLAEFDKEIVKNISLKARYLSTLDYERVSRPNGSVHRLDAVLTARINRWLASTVSATMLFDNDQHPDIQYQHILGLGLNVSL